MAVCSAGLVVYRTRDGQFEVVLGRLGGPYWEHRQHWTVPKGIVEEGEDPQAAARREFQEETGIGPPAGELLPLGEITQRGGKLVVAWAVEGDVDLAAFNPGTFELEWPPDSGRTGRFPELVEVRWFPLAEAKQRVNQAQVPLLERLEVLLSAR